MKCIVKKGSPLFDQISNLRRRIDQCKAEARKVAEEFGFEGTVAYESNLGTGIAGLIPKNGVPEGFKKINWQAVFPKRTKANKELLDRISALPKLDAEDVNSIIGYEPEWKGLSLCRRPGIIFGEEFHLLTFSTGTKYKPIRGMREIKDSEFTRLSEQSKKEPVEAA